MHVLTHPFPTRSYSDVNEEVGRGLGNEHRCGDHLITVGRWAHGDQLDCLRPVLQGFNRPALGDGDIELQIKASLSLGETLFALGDALATRSECGADSVLKMCGMGSAGACWREIGRAHV